MSQNERLVVIGGCGHVGLPLAILTALSGRHTTILDVDRDALARVSAGQMPFLEEDAEPLLREALASGRLTATDSAEVIRDADVIVMVIGTPIDEYLTPRVDIIFEALRQTLTHFRDGQVLVLRSTVYPGVSEKVQRFFDQQGLDVAVAFCPERVAQGRSLRELRQLPQIISGFSTRAIDTARELFSAFAASVLVLEPLEAELAKLFSNTFRYLQFAMTNQFYMIAQSHGADYHRIHTAMCQDYPRLSGLPKPGLAAGPCLFKDTMQLAAFSKHNFSLGLAAIWVNEGLPQFLVEELAKRCALEHATVGILGMAFKADNDDPRDSLSYKLRKLLRVTAKAVLCHDPYIRDPSFVDLGELLEGSDALVVATPHRQYREIVVPEGKPVIDVWAWLPEANRIHQGENP
jgi:UDP-N-acetyl-D-mannosaminuronic acid dehydrogenase